MESKIKNLRKAVEQYQDVDDMGEALYNASSAVVASASGSMSGLGKLKRAVAAFERMADDGEAMYEAAAELLEKL